MHRARWTLIALVLALLAGLAPAYAAGPNVVVIEAGTEDKPKDLPTLLSEEEVEKLQALQQDPNGFGLISPISPDGTTAWGVVGDQIGFLNVQTGELQPVNLDAFGPIAPAAFFGEAPLAWLDEDNLGGLGVNFAAQEIGAALVLVTLNKRTGEVGVRPLDPGAVAFFLEERSIPFSFGPNGTRLLIAVLPEEEEEAVEEGLMPVRLSLPQPQRASFTTRIPQAAQARLARIEGRFPGLLARLQRPVTYDAARAVMQVTTTTIPIVYVDMLTGERRELLTFEEAVAPVAVAWSPDSARIAVTFTGFPDAQEENPRPIFDGALISEEIYRDVTGQFPPNENPYLVNNTVRIFDMGTGLDRDIKGINGDGAFLMGIGWNTDNKTLLVQAIYPARLAGRRYPIYTFQFSERYVYRFYNEELRQTGSFALPGLMAGSGFGPYSATFASPDELIFTAMNGSNIYPYYYNRGSGELRNLADRAGVFLVQGIAPRTRQIVYAHSSFTSPFDMYRVGWDGKALARLTWVNEELRQQGSATQHPVSFRLRNGATRVGTLILPEGVAFPPRNVPIVVWQEGGPGGAMYNFWASYVEAPYTLLPNFGFGLLVVPLAGREGYDAGTYKALYDGKNFGAVDIDEQAEIVNQMISRGWTSRGRVGITGCSYGGYFAWQSIIRHPDLYAAANPQCAAVDWFTEWSRGYAALLPFIQGPVTPYDDPAEYRADSPTYNLARVKTPVLSFHGSFDFLPYVQNENMHLRLVQQGKTSRFIRFMGAGHGLLSVCCDVPADAAQRYELYAAQEQIQWFRTYLK